MSHSRHRYLHDLLTPTIKWSPATGVIGLRQVGKTTLVKTLADEFHGNFVTLDDESSLDQSRDRPAEFLTRNRLLCIDEVQLSPGLFPKIKDIIGVRRKPSRFLLTGSIRFTLKEEIRESLTGRIIVYELLPFVVAETRHDTGADFLEKVFHLHESSPADLGEFRERFARMIGSFRATPEFELVRHMLRGGLPIPCFTRDEARRKMWYQLYFESLITRDLALYDERLKNIPLRQGLAALFELAQHQQQEINVSRLVKASGLSRTMAGLFMRGLEALCLIDFIPPRPRAVKAVKKLQVQWKDVGLWSALTQIPADQIRNHPVAINLLLSTEFRSQIQRLPGTILWSHYRHRDGAAIPWIFTKGQTSLAIASISLEVPRRYDFNVLRSFMKDRPRSFAVLLTAASAEPSVVTRNIVTLPYNRVF